jgi:Na+/H+ antiporter NhaC
MGSRQYKQGMSTTRIVTTLVVGLLLIAGTRILPIAPDRVAHHTISRSVTEFLGTAAALKEGDDVLSVRLDMEGSLGVEAARAALQSHPRIRIDDQGTHVFRARFRTEPSGTIDIQMQLGDDKAEQSLELATWRSLVPPLIALVFAVGLRHVVGAMLLAVLAGAWMIGGGALGAASSAFLSILGGVLGSVFNLQILGFSFALVGMIAVVNRMGGTQGLIALITRFTRTARQTQIATALMGTAIFFDDYANTVVVGTTARKLTDSKGISREKLAYIVDSTSAPIAGLALVSTWIGYEVGLFDSLVPAMASVDGLPKDGYSLFFEALPMRFYCVFALTLVFLSAFMRRDLGPMWHAERRARTGGPAVPPGGNEESDVQLEKEGAPHRWYNAIIPIGSVLVFIFSAIITVGGAALTETFSPFSLDHWQIVFTGASDDIASILFWSSIAASLLAIGLAKGQDILTLRESAQAYTGGVRSLGEAALVLILAWAIKDVCDGLDTGMAMVALIGDHLPPMLLPLVVFILSGFIALCTGTSWGTMAVMLPVAVPLAVALSGEALIVIICLGAVLDGAIWGDHISPLSDTTVLSSSATGCPLIDHVKTQAPYAILAMLAAGGGYLLSGRGISLWICYSLGFAILIGGLLLFGRNPEVGESP